MLLKFSANIIKIYGKAKFGEIISYAFHTKLNNLQRDAILMNTGQEQTDKTDFWNADESKKVVLYLPTYMAFKIVLPIF